MLPKNLFVSKLIQSFIPNFLPQFTQKTKKKLSKHNFTAKLVLIKTQI